MLKDEKCRENGKMTEQRKFYLFFQMIFVTEDAICLLDFIQLSHIIVPGMEINGSS